MSGRQGAEFPIPILMNAKAGMGGGTEAELVGEARALGLDVEVRRVEPHRLEEELVRSVERALPLVGVAGGDGTMRTAAATLAGSGTALAPVPAGTLNRFSRRLGVFSINQALHWMARGDSRPLPIGFVDDQVFLNTAVFGFYADLVRKRERLRRWMTKWPAAGVSGAVLLARMPLIDVAIELEGSGGERIRRTTPLVWIGLGGGSFPFVHKAPHESPSLLEVAIVRSTTRRGMTILGLRLLARIIRRQRPIRAPGVELFQARQVVLRASGRVGTVLDGEPIRLTAPILTRVQEGALRVVSPPRSIPVEGGDAATPPPEGLAVPIDPRSHG